MRCIVPARISQIESHDKSLSPSFVLFETLLVEMNVLFSGLIKIILIEDFVQYLLDCLKRRGWDFGYQLLSCPNGTVIPLSLHGRRLFSRTSIRCPGSKKSPWRLATLEPSPQHCADDPVKKESNRFRTVFKEIAGRGDEGSNPPQDLQKRTELAIIFL